MSLHHMLRAAAGRNTPAPPASNDPKFNYVALLLHGDGTNGAQNNTFLDSSTNNFTITRNGNTTQGSLSPYGNLWSNYFDGSGDYLTVGGGMPSGQGTEFTLEFWAYAISVKEHTFTQGASGGTLDFYVNSSGAVKLDNTGIAAIASSANNAFPYNTWVHIALTRTTGNVYTIYINGVSVATGTNSTSMTANTTIGQHRSTGASYFFGYMSNWRVTNTRVYTSNFTPPTAPLTAISGTSLLTCQSNRFIDNSANNFTITRTGDVRVTKESPFLPTAAYSTSTIGGSGYFDGTGDYLSLPDDNAFEFGSGDFTVEAWVNFGSVATTSGNYNTIICNDNIGVTRGWLFITDGDNGGKINFTVFSGATAYNVLSASAPSTNQWIHAAAVRNGGTLTLYLNGVAVSTNTTLGTVSVNTVTGTSFVGALKVNGSPHSPAYFNGYLSNLRIVKGTAVYTSNFTPPTAPLTAISGTSLLLNFTNAGIFDNAAENNLETVGNAQISTSVKKYGTGSLAFDGNGDGLVAAGLSPTLVNYDFTWECWVNFSSLSGGPCLINVGTSSTNRTLLYFDATNGIRYAVDRSGVSQVSIQQGSTTGWSTGVWYHVALVRSGNTYTIYRDGISVASGTSTYAQSIFTTGFNIGFSNTSPFFLYFNGYIDDVRITNGYARYTANFTPPTAAFPDQ